MPQIDEAFARGDLSYSKVRAITRVTNTLDEAELLDYALRTSAADLDIYCSRLRNGDQANAEKLRVASERAVRCHDISVRTAPVQLLWIFRGRK